MRFALHVPNFGAFGEVDALVDVAVLAEDAGWDGVFLWDHVLFAEPDRNPHADVWVALTAMAAATRRVLLGPLVTPLARRLPGELARQTASLQRFSGGRLVLGVGLGAPVEWDFRFFGHPVDPRERAERLDEALEVLRGLWSGRRFSHSGRYYRLEPMTFLPAPEPPVPVWVGGGVNARGPLARAARHDGFVPFGQVAPAELRRALQRIGREPAPDFAVVVAGTTDGSPAATEREVAPFRDIATWWLEDLSPLRLGMGWEQFGDPWDVDRLRARVRAGPPLLG